MEIDQIRGMSSRTQAENTAQAIFGQMKIIMDELKVGSGGRRAADYRGGGCLNKLTDCDWHSWTLVTTPRLGGTGAELRRTATVLPLFQRLRFQHHPQCEATWSG